MDGERTTKLNMVEVAVDEVVVAVMVVVGVAEEGATVVVSSQWTYNQPLLQQYEHYQYLNSNILYNVLTVLPMVPTNNCKMPSIVPKDQFHFPYKLCMHNQMLTLHRVEH